MFMTTTQNNMSSLQIRYMVITKITYNDDTDFIDVSEDDYPNANMLEYLDTVRKVIKKSLIYDKYSTFQQFSNWNDNIINETTRYYTECYNSLDNDKISGVNTISEMEEKIRRHSVVLQVLAWSNYKLDTYYSLCEHIGERSLKKSERTVAYIKIDEKTFTITVYISNLFSRKEEEILNFFIDKGSSRITFREVR